MAKKGTPTTLRTVRITAPMANGETLPSLTKTKGLRALLLLASSKSNKDPKPGDIYESPLEALRDLLRCRDDEHLKTELEGLAGLKLNWHKFDPKARGYSVPVSSCMIRDGMVRFAFDPQFFEAWLDNETGFRKIAWEALQEIRSLHTAKLYELAAYHHEPGELRKTMKMKIAELRELFGVRADQYPGGTFYQQVIDRSVKAVNNGKYGFDVTYCREGRGQGGRHWFEIRPAEEQQRISWVPIAKVNGDGSSALIVERISKALDALPKAQREETLATLRKQGLMRIPDSSSDANYVRSFRSALYGEQITV